jgi:protein SCO1/2
MACNANPSMQPTNGRLSRRNCLLGWGQGLTACLLTTALPGVSAATAEVPLGWVKPRPAAPGWKLTRADGAQISLTQALGGSPQGPTAVQLMFTGCTTTCSTQGLLFATMAARTRATPVNWLSLSIDALGDDAARLAAWQKRFGPTPASWSAAVPGVRDVDALATFLRGTPARSGTHTDQVFVFDRAGQLAYRTGDKPEPHFLEALLTAVG